MGVIDRKPTNISLPEALVAQAKRLGINMSQACQIGLELAIQREQDKLWKEDNKAAFQSYNEWVDKNGIPFSGQRQF